jgi:capsular polysaccharide biosynthesis protein
MLPRFGGRMDVAWASCPWALPEAEPDFIARLPGGRVFGPGVVLAPDGHSLARDVSTDFGKPADEHWVLSYAKIGRPVHIEGATAVVAVALGKNYCHWLLEELPRLLMLSDWATASVIAHRNATFILEAFAFGGFSGRVIEAKRYSHFQCDELIVPSLVGRPEGTTPRAVGLLTEFTAPLLERVGGQGERLYITREKAGRRRVSNEAELCRLLEARGFRKVHAEELSWREQINAFAQAKVIVAPHGAGLANLVFCQPGARVVELFNRAYVNPCFGRLAALKALDYRPLIWGAGEGVACELKANRNDIFADIDSVAKALA